MNSPIKVSELIPLCLVADAAVRDDIDNETFVSGIGQLLEQAARWPADKRFTGWIDHHSFRVFQHRQYAVLSSMVEPVALFSLHHDHVLSA